MKKTYDIAKKIVITIIGVTVLLIGVAMLVLPGPGILVIIAGLAILAVEFTWAQNYLNKAKNHFERIKEKAKRSKKLD